METIIGDYIGTTIGIHSPIPWSLLSTRQVKQVRRSFPPHSTQTRLTRYQEILSLSGFHSTPKPSPDLKAKQKSLRKQ